MKTMIPLMLGQLRTPEDKSFYLNMLKTVGAQAVAITLGSFGETEQTAEYLQEDRLFFEYNGFETALWFGGSLLHFAYPDSGRFTKRVDVFGNALENHFCPLDEAFVRYYCEQVRICLRSGFQTAFFDDDFRLNYWTGAAQCFCEKHMGRYRQILGEEATLPQFQKNLLLGAPNRFRAAWMQATKESLVSFAKRLRETADEVDETIRLGFASSAEHWWLPGCVKELSQAFAGKNRPWLRLTGAPYWNNDSDPAYSIETERLLYSIVSDSDYELYSEGDSFPHYRVFCSCASMELFETAIRSLCPTLNHLKYVHPYEDTAGSELCYIDAAKRDRVRYKPIEAAFAGKEPVGYRIMESPETPTVETYDCDRAADNVLLAQYSSLKLAKLNSLPTCYRGKAPRIIMGANAALCAPDDLNDGAVLDFEAAKILDERGIDVGLTLCEPAFVTLSKRRSLNDAAVFEHDLQNGNRIMLREAPEMLPNVSLKDGAQVLTEFSSGKRRYPSSYLYENQNGQRFYVLLLEMKKYADSRFAVQNYIRQKYLISAYAYFCGQPLPAAVSKHPGLYLQAAKDGGSMTVGLWNFSHDAMRNETVQLDKEYQSIRWINGSGTLNGSTVTVDHLPAYEACAFEVN